MRQLLRLWMGTKSLWVLKHCWHRQVVTLGTGGVCVSNPALLMCVVVMCVYRQCMLSLCQKPVAYEGGVLGLGFQPCTLNPLYEQNKAGMGPPGAWMMSLAT